MQLSVFYNKHNYICDNERLSLLLHSETFSVDEDMQGSFHDVFGLASRENVYDIEFEQGAEQLLSMVLHLRKVKDRLKQKG